ncbi:MAG: methyl-accepting chemotaxis protein, partial [Chitinivibrionales bacterium]|nr:methyl-accepting chemotaxis protein [Chitinivibrionales bacterium]
MFNNMKLSVKIAVGFGSLILIIVVLGGLAIFNMNSVKAKSEILAKEYVPEVDIAVKLRGAANRVMYAMRGYGLSEEDTYYTDAKNEIKAVESAISSAGELQKRAVHLEALKGHLETANGAVEKYKRLMDKTVEINSNLAHDRESMDKAAAVYISSCNTYLAGQNSRMNKEIAGRQTNMARHKKITIV